MAHGVGQARRKRGRRTRVLIRVVPTATFADGNPPSLPEGYSPVGFTRVATRLTYGTLDGTLPRSGSTKRAPLARVRRTVRLPRETSPEDPKKRKRAKSKKKKNGERAGGRASRADRARGRAYVRRKNEENGRRAARPPAQGRRRSQLRAKRHAGASLFRDTSDHAHRFENRHESFLRDPAVSTARILFEQRTNLRNLFVNNE